MPVVVPVVVPDGGMGRLDAGCLEGRLDAAGGAERFEDAGY